jgi:hypothetical protein
MYRFSQIVNHIVCAVFYTTAEIPLIFAFGDRRLGGPDCVNAQPSIWLILQLRPSATLVAEALRVGLIHGHF